MNTQQPPSQVVLAYDNMCNLAKLKVARSSLPLPQPLDTVWLNVVKIIETFHSGNHVSATCKETFSPEKVKADIIQILILRLGNKHLSGLDVLDTFCVQ